jgi:flagellar basal body-associated protein FliL
MDSTDKLERVEELSRTETEEGGAENVNSDSKIDIFAGDEFESPEQEGTKPVSTPESPTEDANTNSGSQVDVVAGDVFEGSGLQKPKPNPAPERPDDKAAEEQGRKETKPNSKTEKPPVKQRNYRAKGLLSLLIAVGMSLFLGIGYIYLKDDNFELNNKKLDLVPERKVFPISKGESITFSSFIVPFKENKRFTYISLSIVISLPNKEMRNEMSGKKDHLRGILYDMFKEEINRENGIPPIGHLKKSIIRTVNGVLSVGEIKEVFVTQFLAV